MQRKTTEVFQEFEPREMALLGRLNTPAKVQAYLDKTPYSPDDFYRSPRAVIADRFAHCFDGALFAACALRLQGFPPLLVDLRAVEDDDHVICIFRTKTGWGAVAKSNFAGLRYREPVYKDLRELSMSYFELYYNTARKKTLRSFSEAVNLSRFDSVKWMTENRKLSSIAAQLGRARHTRLLSVQAAKTLQPVDPLNYRAGLLGSDPRGLYIPK